MLIFGRTKNEINSDEKVHQTVQHCSIGCGAALKLFSVGGCLFVRRSVVLHNGNSRNSTQKGLACAVVLKLVCIWRL